MKEGLKLNSCWHADTLSKVPYALVGQWKMGGRNKINSACGKESVMWLRYIYGRTSTLCSPESSSVFLSQRISGADLRRVTSRCSGCFISTHSGSSEEDECLFRPRHVWGVCVCAWVQGCLSMTEYKICSVLLWCSVYIYVSLDMSLCVSLQTFV